MSSVSLMNEKLASKFMQAMQEIASFPLAIEKDKVAQIDMLSASFGQSVGASFFLPFHQRTQDSKSDTAQTSMNAGIFYDSLCATVLPYRSSAFQTLFLGSKKNSTLGNVCASMAAGCHIDESRATELVSPFLTLIHQIYEKKLPTTLRQIDETISRSIWLQEMGQPERALQLCHSVLLSKSYTKDIISIGGKPRKEFYFSFLRDSIKISLDALDYFNATIWMQIVLKKPLWLSLSKQEKNEDWVLAAKSLKGLAAQQEPLLAIAKDAPERHSNRQRLLNNFVAAKFLWNSVVESGAFDVDIVESSQQSCFQAKDSWRSLDLSMVGSVSPNIWKDVGKKEIRGLTEFCGLEVISQSDWKLEDFFPLHQKLKSFYQSILRHAEARSDEKGFMGHCVLAGTPGVAKTSFAHAMGVSAVREARENSFAREIVVVKYPAGFGFGSSYSESATFGRKKLESLNARAKAENLTIIVIADEMELLFSQDNGRGSTSIENSRASQVWYSWLDASRKDSHLFFFFTMNDTTKMPDPVKSRLTDFTVHWSKPQPLVLRNLLRRGHLNFSIPQYIAPRLNFGETNSPRKMFVGDYPSQIQSNASANASDALVACRPSLPLRTAKSILDVHREQVLGNVNISSKTAIFRLTHNFSMTAKSSSPMASFGCSQKSVALELRNCVGIKSKVMVSGSEFDESFLGTSTKNNVVYVASRRKEDVILRALMPERHKPNVDAFLIHLHRWTPTFFFPLRQQNNETHQCVLPLKEMDFGMEIVFPRLWEQVNAIDNFYLCIVARALNGEEVELCKANNVNHQLESILRERKHELLGVPSRHIWDFQSPVGFDFDSRKRKNIKNEIVSQTENNS